MTPEEIKALQDAQAAIHSEFKAYADRSEAEIKKIGVELPETKAALAKMEEKLLDLETKLNRPAAPASEDEGKKATVLAFRKFMADPSSLSADERKHLQPVQISANGEIKTLSSDSLTSAGALLAPAQIEAGIIKDITEMSPIRQIADVGAMNAKSITAKRRTAAAVAAWVAERATTSEDTTLAYALEEMFAHEATCLYKATNSMLEDASENVESELSAEYAEAFAALEGTAFVSGNAVGKPEGLLTNGSIDHIHSGSATVFTADNLIDLVAELKSQYDAGARFILNRKTLAFIRKLKDGAGHYIWQPGYADSFPATILGYPYTLCTDLAYPTSGTFTTGVYPVLFGNFKAGYKIRDRRGITIKRLAELYAASGEVGFLGSMRTAGMVQNPAAIKKLLINT